MDTRRAGTGARRSDNVRSPIRCLVYDENLTASSKESAELLSLSSSLFLQHYSACYLFHALAFSHANIKHICRLLVPRSKWYWPILALSPPPRVDLSHEKRAGLPIYLANLHPNHSQYDYIARARLSVSSLQRTSALSHRNQHIKDTERVYPVVGLSPLLPPKQRFTVYMYFAKDFTKTASSSKQHLENIEGSNFTTIPQILARDFNMYSALLAERRPCLPQ
ncbi:hypothetical protein BDW62DRAFT_199432 [Aspergillus aurantiobrunneus]